MWPIIIGEIIQWIGRVKRRRRRHLGGGAAWGDITAIFRRFITVIAANDNVGRLVVIEINSAGKTTNAVPEEKDMMLSSVLIAATAIATGRHDDDTINLEPAALQYVEEEREWSHRCRS